jgi:hypothetical protein
VQKLQQPSIYLRLVLKYFIDKTKNISFPVKDEPKTSNEDHSSCLFKCQQLLTSHAHQFWQKSEVGHFLAVHKISLYNHPSSVNAEGTSKTTKTDVIDDDINVKVHGKSTSDKTTNNSSKTSRSE